MTGGEYGYMDLESLFRECSCIEYTRTAARGCSASSSTRTTSATWSTGRATESTSCRSQDHHHTPATTPVDRQTKFQCIARHLPFPIPSRPSTSSHNVLPQPHAPRRGEKGPPFRRRRPPRPRRRPKAVASMMSRTHCASTKNNRPASNVRRSAQARRPVGSYLGERSGQRMRARAHPGQRRPASGGTVPAEPPRAEEHVHGALGG